MRDEGQGALDGQTRNLDRFADTFYVLLESFNKKRGRTLDPGQVQTLVSAFEDISNKNQEMANEIRQLREELDIARQELKEAKEKKGRLWRP